MKKRYVLKNKKRFSMFVILAAIIVSVMLFATSAYGYQGIKSREVSVRQGDTLWTIAKEYEGKSDIRKFIFQIKKLNHMSSGDIFAGDTILIPDN